MFWCCAAPLEEKIETSPKIIDLKEIVAERAWKVFHSTLGYVQKKRWKRKDFDIIVPANYYIFEDVTTTADQEELMKNNNMNLKHGKESDTVTVETMFNNETGEQQTYKFRYEKLRKTCLTVSYQKGFTFGTSTNFKVGLPQLLGGETGGDVGFSTEYQVTSNKEETFEEQVTMEATSDIAVHSNSCLVADVKLDDMRIMKTFRSRTRMRIPQGYAPVYIKRKSDGKQVSVYVVNNLKDVFGSCSCVQATTDQPGQRGPLAVGDGIAESSADGSKGQAADPPVYDGKWIDLITEGYVEGTFACNHQIMLRHVDPPGTTVTPIKNNNTSL